MCELVVAVGLNQNNNNALALRWWHHLEPLAPAWTGLFSPTNTLKPKNLCQEVGMSWLSCLSWACFLLKFRGRVFNALSPWCRKMPRRQEREVWDLFFALPFPPYEKVTPLHSTGVLSRGSVFSSGHMQYCKWEKSRLRIKYNSRGKTENLFIGTDSKALQQTFTLFC